MPTEIKSAKNDASSNPVRLRVLIVEDNEALAKTTGWIIESMEHDYLICTNSHQALDSVDTYLPHAAILDIGLPEMNGFELCEAMQSLKGMEHTKFIAQTGISTDAYRHRAAESGFHYFLFKPAPMEALGKIIEEIRTAVHSDIF